ncbi:Holliday junction resolvase RuvX [Nitrosophilus labii]|uniref:Holliday junction resolvase RuvX n=1 Tax=Nitrosophilus labii TaxID=2706014 RepID=UPI001657011A|nr:Holliday junction resolvase RuvX [Nitrosophilus labii]
MKKLAAIDIGLKRIGFAISLDGKIVLPQNVVIRKNRNQAANDVSKILKEWDIETLVVGVPIGGSSEDEMRKRVEHFVKLLDFEGEVFFIDESFSSHEAKELTKGKIKQKKDGKIDSIAAALILERFLESKKW